MTHPEMKRRIRVPIFEYVSMTSGRPHRVQYAVNNAGKVFRRYWLEPVIRFRIRRDGTPVKGFWESWRLSESVVPADARPTDQFANVPRD